MRSRKPRTCADTRWRMRRFNGAVTLRSRKPLPAGPPASRRGRFNGAVTLRSRKPVTLQPQPVDITGLQWGRDLAVTETALDDQLITWRGYSLQWGRDLAVTETGCGALRGFHHRRLQWGRDLAVTETAPAQMPVGSALCYETASGLRRVGDLAASSQLLTRWRSPEIPCNRPLRAPSAHPSPPRRSRQQVRSSSCSSFTLRLSGCQGTRAATPPRSGFFPLPSSGPAP